MIAARLAVLLVAGWLVLGAIGVSATGWPVSALRVAVCAVFGLLAPLFWPGRGPTAGATVVRVAAWSVGVAGLALASLVWLVHPAQPIISHVGACALLVPMLLLAHGAAALLQARSSGEAGAATARERAGRGVCLMLALLGALPLWLGPAAERASHTHAAAVDLVTALSPLSHLALAAGNDLLRNPWFYEHANLAGLQVNEPGLDTVLMGYAGAGVVLGLVAATRRRRSPAALSATLVALEKE